MESTPQWDSAEMQRFLALQEHIYQQKRDGHSAGTNDQGADGLEAPVNRVLNYAALPPPVIDYGVAPNPSDACTPPDATSGSFEATQNHLGDTQDQGIPSHDIPPPHGAPNLDTAVSVRVSSRSLQSSPHGNSSRQKSTLIASGQKDKVPERVKRLRKSSKFRIDGRVSSKSSDKQPKKTRYELAQEKKREREMKKAQLGGGSPNRGSTEGAAEKTGWVLRAYRFASSAMLAV